ncbi:hypothetical protein EDC01DRAFT_726869 [Geopyxis carbonaria]|nr:hypothetical protein EDC01DRAFT_726869 [Geopyxis carbonaria]
MAPFRRCLGALVHSAHTLSTRRLILFLASILLLSTTLLLFTPSLTTISPSQLPAALPAALSAHIPSVPFPFGGPAIHAPPKALTNSTRSTDRWFGSYHWLSNPFSSALTADTRIALPPQLERCTVHTYYTTPTNATQAAADDAMLLTWRRAWWAAGFRPLVLGEGEAQRHGLYDEVYRARQRLSPELHTELLRWLAWARLGAGVLADFRVLPMGPADDVTLAALRRCQFRGASRFRGFDKTLYTGDTAAVEAVLRSVVAHPPAADVASIEAAAPAELLREEARPAALADYSDAAKKYPGLAAADLHKLVNAHLHATFRSHYGSGISILSPFSSSFNAVHHAALLLAHRLAACPPSPLPTSCPPHLQTCTSCTKAAAIHSPPTYTNASSTFLLATVPHPMLTLELTTHDLSLLRDDAAKSVRWLRRSAPRDPWVRAVTADIVTAGAGNAPRLVALKAAIAAPPGEKPLSLWATDATAGTVFGNDAEVAWTLGFSLPGVEKLGLELPVAPAEQVVAVEGVGKVVKLGKGGKGKGKVLGVVEGWCMGDTEAWRFVDAWSARRRAVRMEWSKGERRFGVGLGEEEK